MRSVRRRMLTTPEMASEPYWAAAPSRSTSTLFTIAVGMVFMSTAAEPRPMEPFTFTSEDAWRRLELTSTRVWSGAMPRRVAGRMVSVPSVMAGRGKFSEGRAIDSAWFISVVPTFLRVSAEMMSTGAAVSSAVRFATRVPVTTTVVGSAWEAAAGPAGACSCACDAPANSEAMARANTVFSATFFCIFVSSC